MRDLAESTAAQADRINAQVFGVAQPTTPAGPGRPRWQGTELPTPGPDPDTPVMDAGLDPSPDPRTAVAGVEGDGHPAAPNAHVAEQAEQVPASVQGTTDLAEVGHPDPASSTPGTVAATTAPVRENLAAAAATNPDAVAGEDEASSPFDNGVLLTELATDTTFANTG